MFSHHTLPRTRLGILAALVLCGINSTFVASAQTQSAGTNYAAQTKTATAVRRSAHTKNVCANCIRAHMEFLASDALEGRGSGTHDELVAATYIAAELREYGIEPAGDDAEYIQTVTLLHRNVATAPELTFSASNTPAQEVVWKHGNEFLTVYLTRSAFSGPLQKVSADTREPKIKSGSVVFVTPSDKQRLQSAVRNAFAQGAAAALIPVSAERREHWHELSGKLPELPVQVEGGPENALGENYNVLALSDEAQKVIEALPDGTDLRFDGHAGPPQKSTTWNVVGILRGRNPEQKKNAILLTAHLDHLGIGKAVNGDDIYNGADDDASGTSAVLELARVLGKGQRPRRTVIFALFGSEEAGGLGSTYFREHPPLPLSEIVANLEFEMIGRPDPKLKADTLWLSGWERSNLGPELATHGANLMGDPHPEQNFFRRSDNYVLAKKGVVAQTVSSFGLHQDYHQPSDDLAHIDFKHMDAAIESLIGPVEWLVNSDFAPKWKPGGQP